MEDFGNRGQAKQASNCVCRSAKEKYVCSWNLCLVFPRHGDLSLSQFLFHVQDARIVLTDFGFAGWSIQDSKHVQCPILGWPVNRPKHSGLGFGTCKKKYNLSQSWSRN